MPLSQSLWHHREPNKSRKETKMRMWRRSILVFILKISRDDFPLSPTCCLSISCCTALCFWCGTRRLVSGLPWRRSTGRTWCWGTKSSRCLWSGTFSPLLKTLLWCLCSAPLRHGGTCAWSWSMLKVGCNCPCVHIVCLDNQVFCLETEIYAVFESHFFAFKPPSGCETA